MVKGSAVKIETIDLNQKRASISDKNQFAPKYDMIYNVKAVITYSF